MLLSLCCSFSHSRAILIILIMCQLLIPHYVGLLHLGQAVVMNFKSSKSDFLTTDVKLVSVSQ